ncbi:MAG: hypothetical protein CMJ78_22160 [Planctomycetaceae bacterium]|nr:hypothetical protein [Planctomycetaceae bacterium]
MSQSAEQVLDQVYLEVRAKILEVGASLDRISRSSGDVASDERIQKLLAGIEALGTSDDNRAERIQLIFSDDYVDGWNQ